MHLYKKHFGVGIYSSANSHPGSETKSLAVFTDDIQGYVGSKIIKRFRYRRGDGLSHTKALTEAMAFIN